MMGLFLTMRERVRSLGGTLAIESPARCGTVLSVRVPLKACAGAFAESRTAGVLVLAAAGSAA